MTDAPDISQRKLDHLALCLDEDVEARARTTLLEEVELVHDSLPELAVDALDASTELLGKRLRVPLVITGMSGGVGRAVELNRALAEVAEAHGMAFGFGSQRPMLERDELPPGYAVRDIAPSCLVLGNLGAVQVARTSTSAVRELLEKVGADALAIHLNPAQELVQPEGDRDFRGCLDGIARLVDELPLPVLVKETGCGLGPAALARLRTAGVRCVDVSGAGGTTWVGVESRRAGGSRAALGAHLWDWGTPTAVATALAVRAGFSTVASGGLRTGLDAARALALGADAAGLALPFLRAFAAGGREQLEATVAALVEELHAVLLLTGSRTLGDLRRAPRVLGPRLQRWLEQLS
jgi:isopentenyl-diphosphate Delta-isomerase